MQFTVPDYYKQFTCTAGQCPATCCAGWQIQIDPASCRLADPDRSDVIEEIPEDKRTVKEQAEK